MSVPFPVFAAFNPSFILPLSNTSNTVTHSAPTSLRQTHSPLSWLLSSITFTCVIHGWCKELLGGRSIRLKPVTNISIPMSNYIQTFNIFFLSWSKSLPAVPGGISPQTVTRFPFTYSLLYLRLCIISACEMGFVTGEADRNSRCGEKNGMWTEKAAAKGERWWKTSEGSSVHHRC